VGQVGGAPLASQGMNWRVGTRGKRPARGQSLVEFALVLPLFLALIFSVVEYSLINSAIGAYNFAAKDAARFGAIVGPSDTGATGYQADTDMLNIIDNHVLGVVAAIPVEVDIFEATEAGTYDTSNPPLQDKWVYSGGSWSAASLNWKPGVRNDQLVSQDYIGVRVVYHYTYVTAFFSSLGATITLSALSVQRIEPQQIYHHPALGTGAAIAALDPLAPLAPSLGFVALIPSWNFKARRAYTTDRKERRK
jgi:Flp pilus assembly protein TadG